MNTRYPLTQEVLRALEPARGPAGRTVYILEAQLGSHYGAARVAVASAPLATELAKYDRQQYPTFRYERFASRQDAFNAACVAFHDLGGELGNLEARTHPKAAGWRCPVEGCMAPAPPARDDDHAAPGA